MVHLSKSATFEIMSGSQELKNEINRLYGGQIRVRACGVLIKDDKLLLVRHEGIGQAGYFWNVPGGSPEKNESLSDCLIREYMEEVGLEVRVEKFIHLNEYIKPPLHAVECYFKVKNHFGIGPILGKDPEMGEKQILSDLKWFSRQDLEALPTFTKPEFMELLWKA